MAYFNYNFAEDIQGKVGTENGIFFKIEEIEIICFNTGICFFTMKTHLENTNKFMDVLDFNYRFKGINSEFASLRNYENIKIQTDTFKDMKDITELISQITGINTKLKGSNQTTEILNSQFYTYSYVCVETSNWNEKTDFINIENDFEIIVSDKYSKHLNKNIFIKINGDIYKFLVVGTFESNYIINDKYFYTSKSTLDKLHESYSFGKYNYIFLVTGYTDLNHSIDILRINGYSSRVISNSYSTLVYNYTASIDGIILFVWLLFSVVVYLLLC